MAVWICCLILQLTTSRSRLHHLTPTRIKTINVLSGTGWTSMHDKALLSHISSHAVWNGRWRHAWLEYYVIHSSCVCGCVWHPTAVAFDEYVNRAMAAKTQPHSIPTHRESTSVLWTCKCLRNHLLLRMRASSVWHRLCCNYESYLDTRVLTGWLTAASSAHTHIWMWDATEEQRQIKKEKGRKKQTKPVFGNEFLIAGSLMCIFMPYAQLIL